MNVYLAALLGIVALTVLIIGIIKIAEKYKQDISITDPRGKKENRYKRRHKR